MLIFEDGVRGLAVDLGDAAIGCVLLGDTARIPAGSIVRGTEEVARVPVGEALLGRVVDALGKPLDGKGAIEDTLLPTQTGGQIAFNLARRPFQIRLARIRIGLRPAAAPAVQDRR